jgi:4-diphosphocytidyl-2C-methyl-D-erythritol kinase
LSPTAAVRIEKNIPAGADWGAARPMPPRLLLGLNRVSGTPLSAEELAAIALTLGADVPMASSVRPCGRAASGEIIDLLESWPALPLLLVWPGQPVSTPACFGALASRDNPGLPEVFRPRLRPTRQTGSANAATISRHRLSVSGPSLVTSLPPCAAPRAVCSPACRAQGRPASAFFQHLRPPSPRQA